MAEQSHAGELGLLLKRLLKERSISMRKLGELANIDKATISRIVNGKRKATPEHLKRISECLNTPIADLFEAAGYPVHTRKGQVPADIHSSIDNIQGILGSYELPPDTFTMERVEQHMEELKQYSQTDEGKKTIIGRFEDKLRKIGSVGPFISELKGMFERFRSRAGTPAEMAVIGSALLYFIISVDIIPDYIFPIGFLDDAITVKLAASLLLAKSWD
ncbi:helix-turn-helix domain-containing protein [Mesobacillus foraminis]|uniref:helix-turn-helix domain-containing protein n=1 Tax=Mesobacillus foraminis TaxID=279826 RepID=UPI001BE81F7C|nr:helix-turn-helix domain-containing protein [Mesobacillus foraminis]MBT2756765.1 helix-turn-helix domain-containing protein [Mesobacillus foraminis]